LLGDAETPLAVRHLERAAHIMTVAYLIAIAVSVRILWR
jgi:hypothetical protein